MKLHPITSMFPAMSDSEYAELRDDIRQHGLHEPIWTHDGKVIDGRHRLKACEELGIEPKSREWKNGDSLVAFVVGANLKRRHLTASQRAACAAEAFGFFEAEAKERKKDGAKKGGETAGRSRTKSDCLPEIVPESNGRDARDEAGSTFSVNPKYVDAARHVQEQDPEVFQKVKAGEVTLPQAKRMVERAKKRETLAAAPKAKDAETSFTLIHGDCVAELAKLEPDSFDLVFADPPYNIGIDYGDGTKADKLSDKDYLDWCRAWLHSCACLIKTSGSIWVLIGDKYAAEYAIILKELGLHRRAWIKWYETFGVNTSNNFNRCSRHLFYCVADQKHFTFNRESVTRPSDRQAKYGDKRADPEGKIWDNVWQIPRLVENAAERIPDFPTQLPLALLTPIVGCSSNPGDAVLDPFCGSGTTGVACIKGERKFTGIEKSKQFWKLANQRLRSTK